MMDSLGPLASVKTPVERDWLHVASSIKNPMCGAALLDMVSEVTGISVNNLKSPRRFIKICRARHIFFSVAREFTTLSFPQIGAIAGGRDHSTAMHGAVKVDGKPDYFEPELSICRNLAEIMVAERNMRRTVNSVDKPLIGHGTTVSP